MGVELKVFFKNENHVCWRNGEVLATSPDMIIAVSDETCEPMTNTAVQEGMKMAVIGLKAVSYTHLDVYKRQNQHPAMCRVLQ